MVSISTMPLTDRLLIVLRRAIPLVPGDVGDHLRELLSPKALAVMATVTAIWAASHFVGIGEIADAFLLATGLLAVGTSGPEGCKKLLSFGAGTANAKTDADFTKAAQDLAKASTVLGIDVVLALIFHGRPKNTFKTMARGHRMPTCKQFKTAMPKAGPTRMYKAELTMTKSRLAGSGGTNPRKMATVGRDFYSAEGRSGVAFQGGREDGLPRAVPSTSEPGFSLLGPVNVGGVLYQACHGVIRADD